MYTDVMKTQRGLEALKMRLWAMELLVPYPLYW